VVRRERVRTSAGEEPAFVFAPRRRGPWSPRLALTPTRVIGRSATATVELPWGDVGRAELYGMPGGAAAGMLGIASRRAGAATWTRGAWLGKVNQRATSYEVSFAAHAFADGPDEVIAAIERYRSDKKRRRRIGEEDEHERLLRDLGQAAARP
jgi:hypothetical protein